MIVLGYVLSGAGVAPAELATADEMTLRYDCFPGDVVLTVDDVDLSARWGWVPVLDFAMALDDAVDGLTRAQDGTQVVDFTENDAVLELTRRGTDVAVTASWTTGRAVVALADLRSGAKGLLQRLLTDLVARFPQLADNPVIVERFGDQVGE